MKKLKFIFFIFIIFIISLIIYLNIGEKMKLGIKVFRNLNNTDISIKAGDDFYNFVNSKWLNENPIPDDYTRYGVFDVLQNTNLERVHNLVKKDKNRVGKLYKIAMNDDKLNKDAIKPLKNIFDEIDNIKTREELPKILGKLNKFTSVFWSDGVGLDEKNSEYYIYNIGQGGLGLSRDYYFDKDEKSIITRKKYKEYITKQSKNFNLNIDIDEFYKLEETMAKSFFTKEKLRNPEENYNKISLSKLKEEYINFDWNLYLKYRGINIKELNINQPNAIKTSILILNNFDLILIKDYLKFSVIKVAVSLLDDKTYDIGFDFYNKFMSGQKEKKPRWKRVISLLNGTLGEDIGKIYVKKYFPEEAKNKMKDLVSNLQKSYALRIKELNWMSEKTKKEALLKLKSFKAKIGYPDVWRDYSNIIIDEKASLFENILNIELAEDDFWIKKIGKKKDKNLWYMNAHTINAYYDPLNNEICFPAGILQYPFFDLKSDDAFNYGAIGSIIGHEMTHGFDDQGRKFDRFGNLKNWWQKEDEEKFEKKTSVLVKFFNKINIIKDIKANGKFTLGENLADLGGVIISYNAFDKFGIKNKKNNNKFTDKQRFFISYAKVWAGHIRDDEMIRLTKMDEHSLNKLRVNAILPHINEWYDAFNVNKNNILYIKPDKRANIW